MQETGNILERLNNEELKILDIIRKNAPITKNTLMLLTKMKLTTLNRVVISFEEKGLIVQNGTGESTGGRKPVLYDLNPNIYYIAGVDISRTFTQVVIVDFKMNIVSSRRFPMDSESTPEKTMSWIIESLSSQLKKNNIAGEKLLGIGIGAVGSIDREQGDLIKADKFPAPGWANVHVKNALHNYFKCPVVVDNGANMAVFAEYLYGNGKGLRSSVYLNCGVGIRTGVINKGIIIRSVNDAEDAFAHMVVDIDGERCSCGNYGCIECYSTITAIVKKFTGELKKGRHSDINMNPEDIDYFHICAAAESGDELAKEVISEAAFILGTGLANFINLLNPDSVILSGPLVEYSKLFCDTAVTTALKKCYKRNGSKITFIRGGCFGDRTIAVGAAAMTLESFINKS